MNRLKLIVINFILIISVFLVSNLLVTGFFEIDLDDGGFFYSLALTMLSIFLYKKYDK